MVIIHIFIQTEIICFYTTNPARIGLFRPHNDFPVPVYRRGRGGMLPADVGQPLLCRQKARSDLQNAVPAALRFFIFAQQFFGYQPLHFSRLGAQGLLAVFLLCTVRRSHFCAKPYKCRRSICSFWVNRRTFLCGGVTLF